MRFVLIVFHLIGLHREKLEEERNKLVDEQKVIQIKYASLEDTKKYLEAFAMRLEEEERRRRTEEKGVREKILELFVSERRALQEERIQFEEDRKKLIRKWDEVSNIFFITIQMILF
jgi:hypothetical protein